MYLSRRDAERGEACRGKGKGRLSMIDLIYGLRRNVRTGTL